MRILAIETSCDDTGVAILKYDKNSPPELLANLVSSQIKIHAPFGGVVPMLAKREHQKNLVPLLRQALKDAGLLSPNGPSERSEESRPNGRSRIRGRSFVPLRGTQDDKIVKNIFDREPELLKKLRPFLKKYQKPDIDALAVTIGPGLEPALWVGVNFARVLGYFWNLPIIPVNHIEAHICANWLMPISASSNVKAQMPKLIFPAICLVVSGGHTQLILIREEKGGRSSERRAAPEGQGWSGCPKERSCARPNKFPFVFQILGETRDDAAGEAFDKLAKMLNLGYPGGPIISREAAKFNSEFRNSNFEIDSKLKIQNSKLVLPRPMINSGDFDFSFSGLKTAAFYLIKKLTPSQIKKLTPAICVEFQQAVVDVLTAKTLAAAKKYQTKTILLSGGVAANDLLRDNLKFEVSNLKLNFSAPAKNFCTDNAAMIALAAYQKNQRKAGWQNLKADANLRI
ncbi:tRNA (adenosine(37)-N6)-threonylcarbamoyltransferase complex transferase subunit TsaD [Patescibacteria group bacterium]|nr:tRNA (adenosine(37)-N6)-threonylcarbamoyltransferase complex transferase subunit TsaD [Patescibacteria group bacterium]